LYISGSFLNGKIKGLEINYNSQPVSSNLIYLSGSLFNDGNRDIAKKQLIKPIKVILPDKYRWVSFDIIDKSTNLDCDIKINDNETEIKWDFFKSAEFFRFHALVERVSNNGIKGINGFLHKCADDLSKGLKFYHRIPNMRDICKEDIFRFKRKDGRGYDWPMVLIYPIMAVAFYVIFINGSPFKNTYSIVNEDNVEYQAIFSKSDIGSKAGNIIIDTINEEEIKSLMRPNLTLEKIDTNPISPRELKQLIIFPIAFLLQGLIELLKRIFQIFRQQKRKKLINLYQATTQFP